MALYKYFKKDTDCNSAFITMRKIEKADEKVKQVLDVSDRNSCSGKLTPRCKYNACILGSHKMKGTAHALTCIDSLPTAIRREINQLGGKYI